MNWLNTKTRMSTCTRCALVSLVIHLISENRPRPWFWGRPVRSNWCVNYPNPHEFGRSMSCKNPKFLVNRIQRRPAGDCLNPCAAEAFMPCIQAWASRLCTEKCRWIHDGYNSSKHILPIPASFKLSWTLGMEQWSQKLFCTVFSVVFPLDLIPKGYG